MASIEISACRTWGSSTFELAWLALYSKLLIITLILAPALGHAGQGKQKLDLTAASYAEQKAEELRKALQALEVERLDSQLKLQLAELSAQLEPMRKQLERMKQQVERGVMSPTDLGQLEAQITVLQQKMVAARTERALHAKELELRAAQHQQHAELSRKMEEYATMKRLFDEQAAASAGERPATGASILSGTVEVAAGERVRAGDVLTIEIRGEPDVPHAYSVRENGAIKLPLSPPLRVQGLTAQEVAQAVTKQLTARGLEGSAVVVHLRRHR